MKQWLQSGGVALGLVLSVALGAGAKGCGEQVLISRVTVEPSQNLENLKLTLAFNPLLRLDLGALFPVGEYGNVFLNRSTDQTPSFELGFSLRTSVVNEQEYLRLEPSEVLPNGESNGLGVALVAVRGAKPVHPQIDLVGYVDVLQGEWLGAAIVFNTPQLQLLEKGLSVRQVLQRNSDDRAILVVSAFGPSYSSDGKLARQAGIALFADFRELIRFNALQDGKAKVLKLQ